MTVALVMIGFGADAEALVLVILALAIQGIANGTSQPPLNAILSNSVDEADLGVAAAAQRMAFSVGSAMGVTALTSIYGGTERASDFLSAYLVGAVLGALALVFSWFLRSTPRHDDTAPKVSGKPIPDASIPAVVGR